MFENVREDFNVYANLTGVRRGKGLLAASWLFDARRFIAALWMFPFSAVVLYRFKRWLHDRHVPILPRLCDWLNIVLWQVQIADNATIGPGLCISHGEVIIAGEVKVGRNCTFNPFSGCGLVHKRRTGHPWEGLVGPTLGDNVFVGVGARIMGPITVGDNVRIGANSIVIHDVPEGAVVIGIPARPLDLDDPEQRALVQDVID
jgi:serine O-acetyltransferase